MRIKDLPYHYTNQTALVEAGAELVSIQIALAVYAF